MAFFVSLLAFLLALTVLVTIHEFGHFWVARKLGVKVLCFSFGFGHRIWHHYDKHGTEFAIRIIPLGGYIKMLDETEGPVPANQLDKAFNRKSLWKRTAIVLAGPIANFLLAILLFWILFVKGIPGVAPIVSTVEPGSIAARAGIKINDEIKLVDGKSVSTLESVFLAVLNHPADNSDVQLVIKRHTPHTTADAKEKITIAIPTSQIANSDKHTTNVFSKLGLKFAEAAMPAIIGEVLPDSPALKAGFEVGDKIIKIDSHAVKNWQVAVSFIRAHPDEVVDITIERKGQIYTIPVELTAISIRDQKRIGQLGIMVQTQTLPNAYLRVERYNPISALGKSIQKVGSLSWLTLKMLGNMAFNRTTWDHLNGPVSIAQGAGQSAKLGVFAYLHFLALISISLGVLNLLPIPILDGGHLFYYAIEAIRGKPLGERGQQIATSIGLSILLLLMTIAFYNDFVNVLSSS